MTVAMEQEILEELGAIKRLLVLALTKQELTQEQIAAALGVDRSVVSRMMSKGKGK